MQSIILAGGRGSRLDPYTRILPKPLFPIGDKPIVSILVSQLKNAGCQEVIISLGYLESLIRAYFQEGNQFGLKIRYSIESEPLGTAGPLRIIDNLANDFLVVNGDELTTLNFRELFEHHLEQQADMTIAVQKKHIHSSFGVLKVNEGRVTAYSEKPTLSYWVSMGIYVMNKRVISLIPENMRFDMPDLVQRLLAEQAKIVSFESEDLWFDIGTLADLEKAQEVFNELKIP